jgi:TonB family protein
MALSALSDFERRIKNLLLPGVDRRPANRGARLAAALATFVIIVPLVILRAQAPLGHADLAGTVVDISGARVPDAVVVASGKGNREVTRANEAGEWSFTGIPAGEYSVEVMARGFSIAKSSIVLVAGQRGTLDQTLPMGKIQETINVVGKGQPRRATAALENTPPKRIRVGGNVQASKLVYQPKLIYPEVAKSLGVEGTVLLSAVIGTDGNLLSVTVMNTLANADLAAAAVESVKQWRYQPTLLNGVPVEISTTITINFKLEM